MSHVLRVGQADQIAYFRAYNTDGSAKTDLTSTTTGLTLSVFRIGASSVSIASLSNKAADNTAHADGAIRSVGGNLYTIDLPDAACASQVPSIVVRGSFTGGVVEGLEHPIVAYDPATVAVGANTTTPPTAAANATQVRTELATELARIDATFSTRPTLAQVEASTVLAKEATVTAVGTNVTTLLGRVTSSVATMWTDLVQMITGSGTANARYTTKALENGPSGSTTVNVTPLSATEPQRVKGTTIRVPMFDRSPIRVGVFDTNDDPVDLTSFSPNVLRVVIESQQQVDLCVVEHADIDVDGGDNNYFTFQPNAAAVEKQANHTWSLVHVASDSPKDWRKKAGGEFVVEYSPGKDS